MQLRFCPTCGSVGYHLAVSSENAMVDYYRCDVCGHVWSISKTHGTSRHVTAEVKNLKIA